MKFSLSVLSIVSSSIIFVFSGCSTHVIEEKPPVIAPIPKEPEPVVEAPKVVEVPVIIEKKVVVNKTVKKPIVNTKVTKKSTKSTMHEDITVNEADINATVIEDLDQKIHENKTREVREILKENPKAIEAVGNSSNKLLYIGPSGWRVIDIIEGFRNKKLDEKSVVAHIKEAKNPYKVYTYEEIQILLKNKVPYKVINAMMIVSR
jgi:hypothetical protein